MIRNDKIVAWGMYLFTGMGSSDEWSEIQEISTPELDMCMDPHIYGGADRYQLPMRGVLGKPHTVIILTYLLFQLGAVY